MRKCLSCGKSNNQEHYSHCLGCGARMGSSGPPSVDAPGVQPSFGAHPASAGLLKCGHCGAKLQPTDEVCGYCQSATGFGIHSAQRRAFAEQERDAASQEYEVRQRNAHSEQAQTALRRTAKHALIFSVVGMLTCFFPLTIVGLVSGLRARGRAKELGLVLPANATLAAMLGMAGLLTALGAGVLVYQRSEQLDAEHQALREQVKASRKNDDLDHATACALAHLHLLDEGYLTASPSTIKKLRCPGKLSQQGNRARLDSIRFHARQKRQPGTKGKRPKTEKLKLVACFAKGESWALEDFRELDETCEGERRAQPSSSASAAPSAANSAAPN